jgi:hypothetical protein
MAASTKRLHALRKLLEKPRDGECGENSTWLTLKGCASVQDGQNPELIPFGYESALLRSRWARAHLQWMQRKDLLNQDIFLLGVHGPLRRWLAFVFCEKVSIDITNLPR